MMVVYKNWKMQEWDLGITISWGLGGIKNLMVNINLGWWTFQFHRKYYEGTFVIDTLDKEWKDVLDALAGE